MHLLSFFIDDNISALSFSLIYLCILF